MNDTIHILTMVTDILPEKTEYKIFKVNNDKLNAPIFLLEILTKSNGIEYEINAKTMTFKSLQKALDYSTNQLENLAKYHSPWLIQTDKNTDVS